MNIGNEIIKLNLNQEQTIKNELSKFAAGSFGGSVKTVQVKAGSRGFSK